MKVSIMILICILIVNCQSERSKCNQNDFGPSSDDGCGGAVAAYWSADIARQSTREVNISADAYQKIGDALLINCVIKTEKRKTCDKKSDIIPHVW